MPCKPGYFGVQCLSPCPLGWFGENCGGECSPICSKELCNSIFGCLNTTMDLLQTNLTGEYQYYVHLYPFSFIEISLGENEIVSYFFFSKGTNSVGTGSTAELSSTTSAQSVVQQTKEMHNTGMTTSNINASYLLVGIGVVFLILIFITHLYQTYRIKKKISFENMKLQYCNKKKTLLFIIR